jgi:hypothetical protein
MAKIKEICCQANVEVDIRKSRRVNQIILRGEGGDVTSAYDEIMNFIMAIEKENRTKVEEELIAKQVACIH